MQLQQSRGRTRPSLVRLVPAVTVTASLLLTVPSQCFVTSVVTMYETTDTLVTGGGELGRITFKIDSLKAHTKSASHITNRLNSGKWHAKGAAHAWFVPGRKNSQETQSSGVQPPVSALSRCPCMLLLNMDVHVIYTAYSMSCMDVCPRPSPRWSKRTGHWADLQKWLWPLAITNVLSTAGGWYN